MISTITIQEATKHALYDDCRDEMIERQRLRELADLKRRHRNAGRNLEFTGQ